MVNGADDFLTGIRQMFTGRAERGATETFVTEAARLVPNLTRDQRENIGTGVSMGLGFISPVPGSNAPRMALAVAGGGQRMASGVTRAARIAEQARAAQIAANGVRVAMSTQDAPSSSTPDAPSSSTPDAPSSSTPDAPSSSTPDAPSSSTPDAPNSTSSSSAVARTPEQSAQAQLLPRSDIDYRLQPGGALRDTARSVHDLAHMSPSDIRTTRRLGSPMARTNRTVALVELRVPGEDGSAVYASGSGGRLSPVQRGALEELGITIIGGIGHAEQNLSAAIPDGAEVLRWGISWGGTQNPNPCTGLCEPIVNRLGGVIER